MNYPSPRYQLFLISLVLLFSLASQAESLTDQLGTARQLLLDGQSAEALELYRELQVEYPENPTIILGVGCAQYAQATAQAELGETEKAVEEFEEAKTTFEQLGGQGDKALRRQGDFNRANCIAQTALVSQDPAKYEASVASLKEAVNTFQNLVRQYPDHDGARQNLSHLRFKLNELLQHPPEEPEQPEVFSVFVNPATDIPRARVEAQENTATLVLPEQQEDQP